MNIDSDSDSAQYDTDWDDSISDRDEYSSEYDTNNSENEYSLLDMMFEKTFVRDDEESIGCLVQVQEILENYLCDLFKEYFAKTDELQKSIGYIAQVETFPKSDLANLFQESYAKTEALRKLVHSSPCSGVTGSGEKELSHCKFQLEADLDCSYHKMFMNRRVEDIPHYEPEYAGDLWRFMEAISDQFQSDPLKDGKFFFEKVVIPVEIPPFMEKVENCCENGPQKSIAMNEEEKNVPIIDEEKMCVEHNLLNENFVPLLKEMDNTCDKVFDDPGISVSLQFAYEFYLRKRPAFFDSVHQLSQLFPHRFPRAINTGYQGHLMRRHGTFNMMNFLSKKFLKHQKIHENAISGTMIQKFREYKQEVENHQLKHKLMKKYLKKMETPDKKCSSENKATTQRGGTRSKGKKGVGEARKGRRRFMRKLRKT